MAGFDFWDTCKAAIAIDSSSEHGNAEYVEFLKKLLAPFDFTIRTQVVEAEGYRGLNLICEKGVGPDVILFDTHLDTVSPGDPALWTETGGNPFGAAIKDGKIFGLGAVDVKLDFLCKIKALEKYIGKRFRNRFILLGTFAEEVGLLGAKAFLDDYKGQLDFALIGEPTSLKLVNRHKGRGCYEFRIAAPSIKEFSETVTLEFQGRSAHSSTPAKGENALALAMDALAAMDNPPEFFSIEGGQLLNVVPQRCRVVVPVSEALENLAADPSYRVSVTRSGAARLPAAQDALVFWKAAKETRRRLSESTTWVFVTAKTTDQGFTFEFDSRFWEDTDSITDESVAAMSPAQCRTLRKTPSFFETSTAWYVEGLCGALEEAGVKAEFDSKMASTEAALFGHRCTTLVFGPGLSEGNAHQPNEFNTVQELEAAIRAYDSILRRLVAVPG